VKGIRVERKTRTLRGGGRLEAEGVLANGERRTNDAANATDATDATDDHRPD
jgi:hypothetical protein